MEWEYRVIKKEAEGMIFPNIDVIDKRFLDGLGKEGWELIQMVPIGRQLGRTVAVHFYFKRELTEERKKLIQEEAKKEKEMRRDSTLEGLPPVPRIH